MSTYSTHLKTGSSLFKKPLHLLRRIQIERGTVSILVILGALVAFEAFNYSTTEFALTDLLGEPRFIGLRWATILALAFCAIELAGIARLLSPRQAGSSNVQPRYLLGAWFLAATMNAILTWYAVSLALVSRQTLGNPILARSTLLKVVPIFVALLVWLIRVLMIGMFTLADARRTAPPSRDRRQAVGTKSVPARKAPADEASKPPRRRPRPVPSLSRDHALPSRRSSVAARPSSQH
ncbi:MAG: hypothetical protein PVF70_01855 [Anaerolineales bacterium]|jgi:hypothetical protein